MSLNHAVIWTDHQSAQILQFDPEHVVASTVHSHTHHTIQHNSAVRSLHEFFGEVCDAVDGVAEVLVTGSHTATADFKHFVDKHRLPLAARILAYDIVDHPSDRQLVALARKFFLHQDKLTGQFIPLR